VNLDESSSPTINESLPTVEIASTDNDKRVFGVISDKTNDNVLTEAAWGATRVLVNSLGEGAMWVCNKNGLFENGDYITTSTIRGLGVYQADDSLRNYTIGKITQDCAFDNADLYIEFDVDGTTYRKQFVGVTYHCG
tara:strand:- start:197 stop:607 length:411 start_codon:yes stop_codon:yes gene_type:complete